MSDDRRAKDPATSDRRAGDRRGRSASRALVPVSPVTDETVERPASPAAEGAVFAAQLIGQTGQRKGLKGGPPVLDAARSTYLETEYSAARDRRPAPGKAKRTDV